MNRQHKITITLLSAAHFVTDSYSSFLLPLLPVIAQKLRLTPAQAGLLIPLQMLTSSLMQPLYGMVSDRYLKRSMSVFGPLIAAIFLSSIGAANSLPVLLAFVTLGGIGIGSFHPQSAAIVSRAGTLHKSTTMSIFSSAGTIGVAVGPLLIAGVVANFGLERSYYTVIFGVLMWLLLLRYCPPLDTRNDSEVGPPIGRTLRTVITPLALLYFATVLRSAVHVSVQTYLAFLLKQQGLSLTETAWVIAGFILFGGVGGLFGGTLADRWGARNVSLHSMLIAGPLMIAALSTQGWLSYVLLAIGGTFLNVGVPINIVMAQRLVQGGASTVSALMMGFAWGAGALLAPITGVLSEYLGFNGALIVMSLLIFGAAALLWRFPKDDRVVNVTRDEAIVVGD